MKPVLKQTSDYEIFEPHFMNRDVERIKNLEKSFLKYGCEPHYAISCVKNGNGKLIVKAGHHRLHVAKKLGIPIWYIVADDSGMTIQEAEEATNPWTMADYLTSYVRSGKPEYQAVEKYMQETGIPLGLVVSLLAGESAGSRNKAKFFKNGTFKLGDQEHPNNVKSIVQLMKANGIDFANRSLCVQAISKVLRVPEVSLPRLKQKIKSHASFFEKQPDLRSYMDEIERIYNRQTSDRLPVAFLADSLSRKRQKNFGKS